MKSVGGSVGAEAFEAKRNDDDIEDISFTGFESNHNDLEHDPLMPEFETHGALNPANTYKTNGASNLSSPLAYADQFELGAVNVLSLELCPSLSVGRCVITFALLCWLGDRICKLDRFQMLAPPSSSRHLRQSRRRHLWGTCMTRMLTCQRSRMARYLLTGGSGILTPSKLWHCFASNSMEARVATILAQLAQKQLLITI